jgi:hypothetical protein
MPRPAAAQAPDWFLAEAGRGVPDIENIVAGLAELDERVFVCKRREQRSESV